MAQQPTVLTEDIAAEAVVTVHPLSHGQQALWFLQQLDLHSSAYNVARAVRIRTPLNIDAVRLALQMAVDRHPGLRTTFADTPSGPAQTIHPHQPVFFQFEEASGWTQVQLEQRLNEETYRPFDLSQDPLLRIFLFQQADDDYLLLLVAHHIICDLWSMVLLISEVPQLYQAALSGVPSPLRPLRYTYADFVRTQNDMLVSAEGDALWAYWRERLADAPTALNLPTDRPRTTVQTDRAASINFRFSVGLGEKLQQLAEAHGTNLYTLMLTAFQVLLHRYTGQTDILIGALRAGRSVRMASVVGFFVNSLVHRAQLEGDPVFADVLTHANTEIAADLAHGTFPFSTLVERLQPERDLSYSPIFQVMMAWQKTTRLVANDSLVALYTGKAGAQFEINGLLFEAVPFHPRVSVFDLGIDVLESADGLSAVLEYNLALFDEATAVRMMAHFDTMLTSIVENPHQRLSQFSLLTDAERRQLVDWNDTALSLAGNQTVPEQVAARAAQTPDAIAITRGEATLTYRELDARANQLAHYLQIAGIKPETPVGLCLPRSIELIVGALGVLKAGGAYVALDPAYPAERLAFMLADSGAPILLTNAQTAQQMPEVTTRVIRLDADWSPIAKMPTHAPGVTIQPNYLAYIIYTSGSTGQPKGVMIEHASVMNLVAHYRAAYQLSSSDRASHLAAPGFDASVGEIWPTLTSGASLHIPEHEVRLDPQALQAWLLAQRITIVDLTTALAEGLVPLAWPSEASVRLVLTGGDVLRLTPERPLPFTLLNCYGPTEATVFVTAGPVHSRQEQAALHTPANAPATPTIGRPLANTQIHILDASLQLAPVGVPGELCISGLGLARGYLNRPELTAEKFVEVLGPDGEQQRVYRTGDQARWLAHGPAAGNIEFLGRADTQVKIRGFRVELGEIEAVLLAHPSVREKATGLTRRLRGHGKRVRVIAWSPTGSGSRSPPSFPRTLPPSRACRKNPRAPPGPSRAGHRPAGLSLQRPRILEAGLPPPLRSPRGRRHSAADLERRLPARWGRFPRRAKRSGLR
ncbi:MAG: amino acid adenylation domain-containing protein, partial [Anaerolineae bacterium]|nr:amino acid adenylation domain-containing protein [Anaerolineae bacterium]